MNISNTLKSIVEYTLPDIFWADVSQYVMSPHADPADIRWLMEHPQVDKNRLAQLYCRNQKAYTPLLEEFLDDKSIDLMAISSMYVLNKNSNKYFVKKLFSTIEDKYMPILFIRYASNPSADPSILEEFFESSGISVNDFVKCYAVNQSASVSLLEKLLKRDDLDIGTFIYSYSHNPKADKNFLDRLNKMRYFL